MGINENIYLDRLAKVFNNPIKSFRYILPLFIGSWYILYFKLFRKNVAIKFPFYAHAPVTIVGQGTVLIRRGCSVVKNVFRGLTIVTQSPNSIVIIGERCLLGGTTIRAKDKVEIGDTTMTAISLIQDSLFVNPCEVNSRMQKDIFPGQGNIYIGNNVWVGGQSIVLGGCNIGNDSVLAAGSLCYSIDVGDYTFSSGNPVKKSLPIEKLLMFKRSK